MTKLNIELILFILVLIPRALSSLFSTLLVFVLPNSFQSLVLSHLLYLLILSLSLFYSVDVILLFSCISLMFS